MWSLYFFVKLDDIRAMLEVDLLGWILVCGMSIVIASAIYFINLGNCKEDKKEDFRANYGKYYKGVIAYCITLIIIFSLSNIASSLLPSTGQMAAIYFGDAALKSETAEIVQRMPPKLANILNDKLDEWIQESTKTIKPIEMIEEINTKEIK